MSDNSFFDDEQELAQEVKKAKKAPQPKKKASVKVKQQKKSAGLSTAIITVIAVVVGLLIFVIGYAVGVHSANTIGDNASPVTQEVPVESTTEDSQAVDEANAMMPDGHPDVTSMLEDQTSADSINATYQSQIDTISNALTNDAENVDLKVKMADTYFDWARSLADYDDQEAQSKQYFSLAVENYTQAMDVYYSNSVAVDRSICFFYSGAQEDGIEAVKEAIAKAPDYAPAYANLGIMLQNTGDNEGALEAYNDAMEKDASGTYGVQSFCQAQIDVINGVSESGTESVTE